MEGTIVHCFEFWQKIARTLLGGLLSSVVEEL